MPFPGDVNKKAISYFRIMVLNVSEIGMSMPEKRQVLP
jgi:hypothetical protein